MSTLKRVAAKLFAGDPVFPRRTDGGIHPRAYKQHSLRSRIMATPIPPQLMVPTGTADNGKVTLFVEVGQRVLKFQRLARVEGDGQGLADVPVHAPTSGTVIGIELAAIADHKSEEQLCLCIETDGQDEALELREEAEFARLSGAELNARIADAGILGMGGAGFPAATKLAMGAHFDIDLLIVNAVECEPYISADEALLREHAERVLAGAEILRLACSARRCVIAIEDCKRDALQAVDDAIRSTPIESSECRVVLVPGKYPAGSERQLIQCVSGIEIAREELPAQHGVLMHNAGTAAAAFAAVVEGRPCISRVTTLCGETLQTPKNFEVLIGTPVKFLFELCGIDYQALSHSVVGGSLMGRELSSTDCAVSKTTNCLIAASEAEFPAKAAEQPCIRCGYCAAACPSKLLPQQLLSYSKTGDSDALISHGLHDCIECGACDYVCPSHIQLVSIFKQGKAAIESRQEVVQRSARWQQRFQYHQYRLKRDREQVLAGKAEQARSAKIAEHEKTETKAAAAAQTFSKEEASREIAAAVARVKARRGEKTSPAKPGIDREKGESE